MNRRTGGLPRTGAVTKAKLGISDRRERRDCLEGKRTWPAGCGSGPADDGARWLLASPHNHCRVG